MGGTVQENTLAQHVCVCACVHRFAAALVGKLPLIPVIGIHQQIANMTATCFKGRHWHITWFQDGLIHTCVRKLPAKCTRLGITRQVANTRHSAGNCLRIGFLYSAGYQHIYK